jgi:hypothetical protein
MKLSPWSSFISGCQHDLFPISFVHMSVCVWRFLLMADYDQGCTVLGQEFGYCIALSGVTRCITILAQAL